MLLVLKFTAIKIYVNIFATVQPFPFKFRRLVPTSNFYLEVDFTLQRYAVLFNKGDFAGHVQCTSFVTS